MTITSRLSQVSLGVICGSIFAAILIALANPRDLTPTPPADPEVLVCPSGNTEDSCYPDYIGNGRWVIRSTK